METNEIISQYLSGEITHDEANAALHLAGSGLQLDPQRNVLTEEEILATTIGVYPEQANGYGLLDTGTGTLDKVEVRKGRLANLNLGDSVEMICVAGKWYYVQGDRLLERDPSAPAPAIPKRPDLRRRQDLAGQTVRQKTKAGLFDVSYDADGYAGEAKRVRLN